MKTRLKSFVFFFDAYQADWSQEKIAAFLTDIGCQTKSGSAVWTGSTIGYILTNERYCGSVLTWKTFTADLYEHKHKKNRADRDQYLYRNRHPAIISQEQFEAVQILIENRKHHMRGSPSLQVINEGIFRGYVPINHHWVNEDPNIYYDVSNAASSTAKKRKIDKRIISAFDLEGYQVVRNQFTQVRYEGPSLTVSGEKITFNLFCMRKFEEVSHVQLLLHPAERKIAIRPCHEHDPHSIRWRRDPNKQLFPKTLSCPHFGTALFGIMNWDPSYMYRIRGIWAKHWDEQIIIFNLANAAPLVVPEDTDGSAHKRRTELCPNEWADDFGEEFYEHVLDNDFFYLAPYSEWHTDAPSIPAPGIEQFSVPSEEQLQQSINNLKRGIGSDD